MLKGAAAALWLAVALAVACPAGARAVPLHTETWAYDDATTPGYCNGGLGASPALVRRWVTFAESSCGAWAHSGSKAISDCHAGGVTYCLVMPYVDTQLVHRDAVPGDLLAVASTGWFLHEPAPHAATRVTGDGTGPDAAYLMNQASAAYQAWWRVYITDSFPGADGLFMDDETASLPFSDLSSPTSREIASTAQLQAAHAAMAQALTRPDGTPFPQVDNTLPDCGNPYERAQGIGPTGDMLAGPVIGLLAEACPESHGAMTAYYPDLLDDMAYVDALPAGFTMLLPYGQAGWPYSDVARRVTEATVLLAYAPGRVVVWPELETNSQDLSIWPEEGIYPTAPLQSMTMPSGPGCLSAASGVACPSGGHNDLEVPGQPGVYRREFRACYDQGSPFGACAAIVNDTSAPVTVQPSWLSQRYTSEIVMRAVPGTTGDVQSGGSIATTGAPFVPGFTIIAPHDALLLARPGDQQGPGGQ